MQQPPRPYEVYRHFKGNPYQIIAIATHSETGEQMVVYQQLYAPYGVYVRPLSMFMSKVDKDKYPEARQEYRFEKVQQPAQETEDTQTVKTEVKETEPSLDEGLVRFLEAESYHEKLEILNMLHVRITDAMIDTMAVSLDIEINSGAIEQRYQEIVNCLLTMERFEGSRLR